jgi:hypothetical protein
VLENLDDGVDAVGLEKAVEILLKFQRETL